MRASLCSIFFFRTPLIWCICMSPRFLLSGFGLWMVSCLLDHSLLVCMHGFAWNTTVSLVFLQPLVTKASNVGIFVDFRELNRCQLCSFASHSYAWNTLNQRFRASSFSDASVSSSWSSVRSASYTILFRAFLFVCYSSLFSLRPFFSFFVSAGRRAESEGRIILFLLPLPQLFLVVLQRLCWFFLSDPNGESKWNIHNGWIEISLTVKSRGTREKQGATVKQRVITFAPSHHQSIHSSIELRSNKYHQTPGMSRAVRRWYWSYCPRWRSWSCCCSRG